MRLPRRLLMILIAVGLQTLPACLMPGFLRNKLAPTTEQPAVPSPKISQFKDLAPGQRMGYSHVGGEAKSVPMPMAEEVTDQVPVPMPKPPTAEPGGLQFSSLLEPKNSTPRPDGPLVMAVRAHLDNQYATAVHHLAGFDRTNQELFLLLLPILDNARSIDLSGRDPKSASTLVKQLSNATELVARSAPLEILTTAFVYKVVQYGVYDPLPANYQFLPGGIALLYAEIDHAPSHPAETHSDKSYVTLLHGSLQLTDSSGQVVELYDKDSGKAVPVLPFTHRTFTRSTVRDFFLKIEFSVPEKPGQYTLTLEVRDPDPERPRRVRKAVEFQVRGK